MVFNNISIISWQSVLLVEETSVPEKTTDLSQVSDKLNNVVSSEPFLSGVRTHNVSGDRHWLHRLLYHTIMTVTAPISDWDLWPSEQIFQQTIVRTSYIQWKDMMSALY